MIYMASKHKFVGTHFATMAECQDCNNRENCKNGDAAGDLNYIIFDLEGFFYLAKRIETFMMYPKLDGDLEKYRQDMIEYKKKHEGIPDLIPQFVVNGAFAAELALKAITFKERREFEYCHNLHRLFYQLPEPHKTVLIEKICRELHQNEETLSISLKNIADLFENFRYCFEHRVVGFSNFFNDFIHIICDYAISLKPADDENDWF